MKIYDLLDVCITFAGEPIVASRVQVEHRARDLTKHMRLRERRRRARKLRKLCARALGKEPKP